MRLVECQVPNPIHGRRLNLALAPLDSTRVSLDVILADLKSPFVPVPQPLPTDWPYFFLGWEQQSARGASDRAPPMYFPLPTYPWPIYLTALSPRVYLAARTGPNEPSLPHDISRRWADVINKLIQPLTSRSASRWEKPCSIGSIGAKWALWPEADRI
jgi:hypothetical protein